MYHYYTQQLCSPVEFTTLETSEWGSREVEGGGPRERREERVLVYTPKSYTTTTKEKAKPKTAGTIQFAVCMSLSLVPFGVLFNSPCVP